MRFGREKNEQRRKKDLEGSLEALRREAAEAQESGDALAEAIAYNNIGTVQCDLKDFEAALESYLKSAALVPETATLDEKITPWGNAAAVARRVDQWVEATAYSLRVDALATMAGDAEQQEVATMMMALVRKQFGKKNFAEPLDAAMAMLPEELRPHVRRDLHADPTFRKDAEAK
ncbi:MAG: hypothetical protein HZB16_24405 [Armatimonadetes bacterium]|nr:hypothetical protein [Armatimonadota bacterium]